MPIRPDRSSSETSGTSRISRTVRHRSRSSASDQRTVAPAHPRTERCPSRLNEPAAVGMVEHLDHLGLTPPHVALEVLQPLARVALRAPLLDDRQRDTELVVADHGVNRSFGPEHSTHGTQYDHRVWQALSAHIPGRLEDALGPRLPSLSGVLADQDVCVRGGAMVVTRECRRGRVQPSRVWWHDADYCVAHSKV